MKLFRVIVACVVLLMVFLFSGCSGCGREQDEGSPAVVGPSREVVSSEPSRPGEPLAQDAMMTHLFELERAELWDEARALCLSYAERLDDELRDVLRVRAVGYKVKEDPSFDPASVYAALALQLKDSPAGRQASDLAWFYQGQNRALLGIHACGTFTVRQDGKDMSSGDFAAELRVMRVSPDVGMHEWVVAAVPSRPSSFISLCLQGHQGVVTSAGQWDVVDLAEKVGEVSSTPELFGTSAMHVTGISQLPNMVQWTFVPNAYVGMQSGAQGVNLWSASLRKPLYRRVVMRKRFHWPPPGADD